MKPPAAVCAVALLILAVVFGSASHETGTVEVARLSEANWERLAPDGKEVDAIYGDYVLRNNRLAAVIAQPLASRHANMTVRDVGGALIDLTANDPQSDQLSAYYPGRRRDPFRSLELLDADGRPLPADRDSYSGKAASVVVRSEAADGRPAAEVTWRLEADVPYLTATTRFTNTGDRPLTVPLEDDVRADAGNEDMLKSPNGTAPLFWIHDRFWDQAYAVEAEDLAIQANSDARTSVLRFQRDGGEDTVTLAPGDSFEFTRRISPGANLLDVKAVADASRGRKAHRVRLAVRDAGGRPVPRARVEVSHAGTLRGSGNTGPDGVLQTALPPGRYTVKAFALGIPIVGGDEEPEASFEVAERDAVQEFAFESGYHPGTVEAEITDEDGQPVPCKVEFIAREGTPQPDFGPQSAAFGVRNLQYAPHGRFTQALPAGRYDVIVSRGPEYDAIFTELTVRPGQNVPLTGRLVRSVDTTGWISSDFHSHSSPSGDNTASQLGRVLNLLCEHIEFAPCTEHNRIDTYQPHIDGLEIGRFISTVSGIELTGQPLPLNHQNAFPLVHYRRTQDGGGPQTDTDVERQIERLALWDDRGEKLVQQNHPDIGWLFFDRSGDGTPDGGFERAFPHINCIEIHPVQNALRLEPFETLPGRRGNNRVFNWLQLLNQGFRIPGVVNTDAHYNFHGSGGLRNWIQSPTDDPAAIDPMDMVRAAQQGRMIMSNGPYLEVDLREAGSREGVTAGQDLSARSGRLELRVRVQCPNWLDIDRVFVLVNGRRHPEHDYTRQKHADRFRDGVVKFEHRLDLELESDSHVVVVAGGEELKLGPVMGPFWGSHQPAALSNPIFVDVDGEGFRPDGDTLGHPLPVKFDPQRE